jgi:hypothetical protein
MIKLGSTSEEKRAMSANDIYLSRLKHLIIVAKAYLKKLRVRKSVGYYFPDQDRRGT